MMKMKGKDIVDRVVERINDIGEIPYDSTILRFIKQLDHRQALELFTLGDISEWKNFRIQSHFINLGNENE